LFSEWTPQIGTVANGKQQDFPLEKDQARDNPNNPQRRIDDDAEDAHATPSIGKNSRKSNKKTNGWKMNVNIHFRKLGFCAQSFLQDSVLESCAHINSFS